MKCDECDGWGEVACTRCKGRRREPFFDRVCPRCDDEEFIPCSCDGGTVEREATSAAPIEISQSADVDVIE